MWVRVTARSKLQCLLLLRCIFEKFEYRRHLDKFALRQFKVYSQNSAYWDLESKSAEQESNKRTVKLVLNAGHILHWNLFDKISMQA